MRVATLAVLCLTAATVIALPATPASAATTITINGTAAGRTAGFRCTGRSAST